MKRKVVIAMLMSMSLAVGGHVAVRAADTSPWSDLTKGKGYYESVETVVDAKIMEALDVDRFGVEESENRGDFISSLYRMAESPLVLDESSFSDVEGTEFVNAVRWAESVGLFEGLDKDFFEKKKDGNILFDAEAEFTREEMAVILYNYAGKVDELDMEHGLKEIEFVKEDKLTKEYFDAVLWAVSNGLMEKDNRNTEKKEEETWRFDEEASRGEVAYALDMYMELRDELLKPVVPQTTNTAVAESSTPNTPVTPGYPTPSIPNTQSVPGNPTPGTPDIDTGNEPAEPVHEHTWVERTKTVEVPEEGHWEKKLVKEAWDEVIHHEAE